MDETRFRPHDLGEVREEGDDVVLDLALDLVDPRHIELGVLSFFPDLFRGLFRHHAQIGQRVGGVRLDLEPDAEFGLGRPDGHHLVTGVAGDHGRHRQGLRVLLTRKDAARKRLIFPAIPASYVAVAGVMAMKVRTILLTPVCAAAVLYVGLCGYLFAEQRHAIYHPRTTALSDPPAGSGYETLAVLVPGIGTLKQW